MHLRAFLIPKLLVWWLKLVANAPGAEFSSQSMCLYTDLRSI